MATIYENDKYLRLPYRKLFRKVKLHQVGNWEILDIIRYIFIKANYTDKIKDGKIYNDPIGEYYEDEYKESTKTIFTVIAGIMDTSNYGNPPIFRLKFQNSITHNYVKKNLRF